MKRSQTMDSMLDGFCRGGAWGAAAGLFFIAVEVAPLIWR
jgi:hypothetical protein